MNGRKLVDVGAGALCAEPFGLPTSPAVLLVAGASSSMDWWERPFCERLAAAGRFVVRYDHRDTGESVCYPPGAPRYALRDLVSDAVAVLDAFELPRAHVAGISMGGMIAQLLALDHPERVETLTLIATSPGAGPGPALPPSSKRLDRLAVAGSPDWTDRAAVIDYLVDRQRELAFAGRFDEVSVREIAGRVVDRTRNIESSLTNHMLIDGGPPSRQRLGQISAPTLIIHGRQDPLFPPGHAVALANEIPAAELLVLDEVGHELPRRAWDQVIAAMLAQPRGSHR